MGGFLICLVLVAVSIVTCSGYVPVYGFEGATTAIQSGKTLHYYIRLDECTQQTGRGHPEYDEPFGSHVTKWRTYIDVNRTDVPYLLFHEQIPVLNRAGNLEQLSRDIKIMANGDVTVQSAAYTADFSSLTYMYTHECTMSTPSAVGNIDFKATEAQPIRLNSFDQIVEALTDGERLHFNTMTFLCPGGAQHSFSGLGGHVSNYEFVYDNTGVISNIRFFVETTIHYALLNNYAVSIDINISNNKTVTIVDSKTSLPNFISMETYVTRCPLEVGQMGGQFSVYV